MNLFSNKCVFILGFQSEIWNDVAMKLLFSRIIEERKIYIILPDLISKSMP